jgi:hypothetical protein
MNTSLQFRVLYRQFLFRLMDVELLSASARGDSNVVLGQFGGMLIFGSVLLSWGAISVGNAIKRGGLAGPVWSAERFLISLTMLTVGLFALVNWDSAFPDRRDALVLGPLPIRARTMFAAKIAAAATAMSLTVAALNCLSAFAWPMVLTPSAAGLAAAARFVGAFWVALFAAGAFLYCAILGLQAVASQLPRRWYLRVSPVLQIAAFAVILGVFCFQSSLPAAWLPPYWFTGLLSELSGLFPAESHAVMAPLARRAIAGLAISIFVAGGAFLLSYLRTLRAIVEQPEVAPGARGGIWLPRFGTGPQTALAHFVIRTLLRSRQHRAILAFYLGGGFALVVLYVAIMEDVMHLTGIDIVHHVNVPMLVASALMLSASWLGTRTVFSLPVDLRANWLFRVIPAPEAAASLAAVRRALLALSAFPVLTISAALFLWFWPWIHAAQHLLVLGLLGSILADLSLKGFRKIPFTCSYLPGKSKVHMVFWFGVIPLIFAMHRLADLEQRAMATPLGFGTIAAILVAAAFAARRIADSAADRGDLEAQFEESPSDALVELRLNG